MSDTLTTMQVFAAKVAAGTATREDLVSHILTIDNGGYETIPTSLGMDWICENEEAFARVVGDVDEFMDWILQIAGIDLDTTNEETCEEITQSGLRHYFLNRFLLRKYLMSLLTLAWRETYIADVYPRVGACNNSWISTAILTGVSRQTIATAILERLRRTHVAPMSVNDVDDFLDYGEGEGNIIRLMRALVLMGIDPDSLGDMNPRLTLDPADSLGEMNPRLTLDPVPAFEAIEERVRLGVKPEESKYERFASFGPWWVLSNDELEQALMICAEKSSGKTLKILGGETLTKRRGFKAIDKIIVCAARHMTSLSGVNVGTLERLLTLSERESLARHLVPVESYGNLHKTTAQFLFRIIVELPKEKRQEFWTDVIEIVLKDVGSSTLYCAWRQLELAETDVEITLRRWLDEDGYLVGTITEGRHPKGRMQWMVEVNDHRFVEDSYFHRYYPKKGDLVLFKPEHGHRLTPHVTSLNFTPVMTDVK